MEGGCPLAPERFIPLLLTATDVKQTAAPPPPPVKAEIAPAVSDAVVEKAVIYPCGAFHTIPPLQTERTSSVASKAITEPVRWCIIVFSEQATKSRDTLVCAGRG
jgi:hypothetical protein